MVMNRQQRRALKSKKAGKSQKFHATPTGALLGKRLNDERQLRGETIKKAKEEGVNIVVKD
tara:strand:- start:239 stop:421 length:183 start_codon:yes stop_codon:yes gene_type:complete